jgi:hypothetical protein
MRMSEYSHVSVNDEGRLEKEPHLTVDQDGRLCYGSFRVAFFVSLGSSVRMVGYATTPEACHE